MNTVPHPDWCSDGESEPAVTVHCGPEAYAGKWRVGLIQIDTAVPGTPLVHLGHPDLVEEHGQMEPDEAIALGIALINQGAAALSRHTVHAAAHVTRSSGSDPCTGGAP